MVGIFNNLGISCIGIKLYGLSETFHINRLQAGHHELLASANTIHI